MRSVMKREERLAIRKQNELKAQQSPHYSIAVSAEQDRHLTPKSQTGLGDRTEQLLKKLGVTQDRYKAAKEAFGLAPECSCPNRIESLNELGLSAKQWKDKVTDWWRGQ